MKQPHKHAELIKAWADGAEIQVQFGGANGDWLDCNDLMSWGESCTYRIKPKKEYTKSNLSTCDLSQLWAIGTNTVYNTQYYSILRKVADEAVKRYIQDNEVNK